MTYNSIKHLCYGRVVLSSVGYIEGLYRFNIRGNVGDVYSLEGLTELGHVDFTIKGVDIPLLELHLINPLSLCVMEDVGRALQIISSEWK